MTVNIFILIFQEKKTDFSLFFGTVPFASPHTYFVFLIGVGVLCRSERRG